MPSSCVRMPLELDRATVASRRLRLGMGRGNCQTNDMPFVMVFCTQQLSSCLLDLAVAARIEPRELPIVLSA